MSTLLHNAGHDAVRLHFFGRIAASLSAADDINGGAEAETVSSSGSDGADADVAMELQRGIELASPSVKQLVSQQYVSPI